MTAPFRNAGTLLGWCLTVMKESEINVNIFGSHFNIKVQDICVMIQRNCKFMRMVK